MGKASLFKRKRQFSLGKKRETSYPGFAKYGQQSLHRDRKRETRPARRVFYFGLRHVFTPILLHTSLILATQSSTASFGRFASSKTIRITPGFFSILKVQVGACSDKSSALELGAADRWRRTRLNLSSLPAPLSLHRERTRSRFFTQSSFSRDFTSSSHLRRPVACAGPITSISSAGIVVPTVIIRDNSVLSIPRAEQIVSRLKFLPSSRAAKTARSMYERSRRS